MGFSSMLCGFGSIQELLANVMLYMLLLICMQGSALCTKLMLRIVLC